MQAVRHHHHYKHHPGGEAPSAPSTLTCFRWVDTDTATARATTLARVVTLVIRITLGETVGGRRVAVKDGTLECLRFYVDTLHETTVYSDVAFKNLREHCMELRVGVLISPAVPDQTRGLFLNIIKTAKGHTWLNFTRGRTSCVAEHGYAHGKKVTILKNVLRWSSVDGVKLLHL